MVKCGDCSVGKPRDSDPEIIDCDDAEEGWAFATDEGNCESFQPKKVD